MKYQKRSLVLEFCAELRNVYFLLIAVFSIGMLITSPQSSGPDEPMNQASGWYSIRNGLTPSSPSTVVSGVPSNLVKGPCYAFQPNVTSECLGRNITGEQTTEFPVFNYPPVYFWIIGIGQIFFGFLNPDLSYLGGRLFGLISILGLLLISMVKLSRLNIKRSSEILFIALTPMSYFVFSTANPSGWEIATAILFFSTLTAELHKKTIKNLVNGKDYQEQFSRPNLPIILSGLLLVFSRPLGFVWLILIFGIVVINLNLFKKIYTFTSVLSSIAIIQIPAFFWFISHPEKSVIPGLTAASSESLINQLPQNIIHSVLSLHEKYKQSWGVLGWLDTRPPNTIYILVGVLFSFFLYKLLRDNAQNWKVVLFTALSLNFIIITFESYKWNVWPNWWQGRYGLPILVCAVLSLLINGNQVYKVKNLRALILIIIAGNTFMLYLNFYRYKFGLWNTIQLQNFLDGIDASILLFSLILIIAISIFLKRTKFTESEIK